MSNEIKVELLWNCAKALKGEQQTHKLLRSYYINACRKLAKNSLQVPKKKFALSQMCPYCGSFWSQSEFELKSLPTQLKLTSKEKNLIEKYENKDGCGKTLSKTERNRAKWLMKKQFKRLTIKCQQCRHKSFVNIENERSKSRSHQPNSVSAEILLKNCKKYAQGTSKEKDDLSAIYLQQKTKKKKVAEKQKKSICNSKARTDRSSSNKVISNTQKQNSLLQLAALLKKPTNDTKTSSKKKLQKLLK